VTGRYRRDDRPLDGETETPLPYRPQARRRRGGKLPALGGFLLLAVCLVLGASQQYSRQQEVTATARQEHDFVPRVQVATVEASPATVSVSLPGTTAAFAAANIYARATGYIAKRNIDIGDRVRAGNCWRSSPYRSSMTRLCRTSRS
jgi:multidrug efflux pump subunit AcrA (membrane-fusion protein)